MEPYFIVAWILTGVVAAVAIAVAIYQNRTGKQWSPEKRAAVLNALNDAGTTIVRALQDGIITRDEARGILESVIYVLAAVLKTDTKTAAGIIPGASEEIDKLSASYPADNTEIKTN